MESSPLPDLSGQPNFAAAVRATAEFLQTRFPGTRWELRAPTATPAGSVCLSLRRADGSVWGELSQIDVASSAEALAAAQPLLDLLARLLGDLLNAELRAGEQARRAEQAEADALIDSLTGLYNRRGWDRLIAAEESRCRRSGESVYLLSIDLDGFKQLNDTRGHAAGDAALMNAAHTIRAQLRQPDIAARIGGDEFAILAINCDSAGGQKLTARLQKSLDFAGVWASIGEAAWDRRHDVAQALREADAVMYERKRAKQGGFPSPR